MQDIFILPKTSPKNRVIPNDLIRSSLFTVSNHNKKREYLKNKVLYTFGETNIGYTGEELRQDDEDIWLQLIHFAAKERLDFIEFMPYSMLKQLGWPSRMQYRDKLKASLERMSATSLSIRNKSIKTGISMSLVRKFIWNDDAGKALKKWRVWLEPELIQLFSENQFTRIHWEQRRKLNPLAKWLHSYYSSHAKPYPIPVPMLKKACGSKAKTLKHFKATLKDALRELVQLGFIKEFFIDASNKVHVTRIKKHFGFLHHEPF